MRHYVGLDVSLTKTSICILDDAGGIVREGEAPTNALAIAGWLGARSASIHRIGLEAGATSRSLQRALTQEGLPVVCIEAQHAHKVLSARLNKTDRNDAHGIANLVRMNMCKTVHLKSEKSQQAQALLAARKLLLRKRLDVENAIASFLREFGFKLGRVKRAEYKERVHRLVRGTTWLARLIQPLLRIWSVLNVQYAKLDAHMNHCAKADPVCRRLMTAPGVGSLVALTYRVVVDDPSRFQRSRAVGAHLGLTPKTYQSGSTDYRGRISKWGDKELRTALVLSANVILTPRCRKTDLKRWAEQVSARRGRSKAVVALARRLAVILHRMWIDGADFRAQVSSA